MKKKIYVCIYIYSLDYCMQMLKICLAMATTLCETASFFSPGPKSMSPRFVAFLRPAYCRPEMISSLCSLTLALFRPPWEVTKAISLSTTCWWEVEAWAVTFTKGEKNLSCCPWIQCSFWQLLWWLLQSQSWGLVSKLLIPSALWMLVF